MRIKTIEYLGEHTVKLTFGDGEFERVPGLALEGY
jgi:hypothetical protein